MIATLHVRFEDEDDDEYENDGLLCALR